MAFVSMQINLIKYVLAFLFLALGNFVVDGQSLVKFILVHDNGQEVYVDAISRVLKSNDVNAANTYDLIVVEVEEDSNEFDKMCNAFTADGTFIIDISWSGYEPIKQISKEFNAPYLRLDVSISPHLDLLDRYLDARNTTDVALVFDNPSHVDQTLYYWIDTTRLRMVVTEKLDSVSSKRLKEMRPTPNAYTLITSTANMNTLYNQISTDGLLKLPERWNLLILDFEYDSLYRADLIKNVNILYLDKSVCCGLKEMEPCECFSEEDLYKAFIDAVVKRLLPFVSELVTEPQTEKIKCNETKFDQSVYDEFYKRLDGTFGMMEDVVIEENEILRIRAIGVVETMMELGESEVVAKYVHGDGLEVIKPERMKPVRAFYRIGTSYALPWSYEEAEPVSGIKYWTGYCVDFAEKLSQLMDFDYELVIPQKGTFGEKDEFGNWDGVVGDLVRGQTDLAIAALTMTADREEVIDFVAPYYEQVGITIVMRKPVRKTSLFKFMTVLKLEVWLSIVGALVVTGFMVWFLDKYSPYSARNNKKAYPYPTRQFNLKESFWFALTSFTPQGGGEAPKALSGRTLVAAYWLFVVLMLATFTANLAAFLTVERMQTPVQSLEQLARQSRINYTVVESSDTHKYFINMKHAEDTLYRMWKELTLNASTDNTQYRVWDYPIREQYGQILIAINDSITMKSAEEGFDKVDERLDADFAFIHDSAEVKYEISQNCNLTEVGEVFAERPYAVAIQQGSHLQDTISIMILDLQKDRFFESLQAKYWNHSRKGDCASADDNEGITLESLGGVFIATLFGLVLAMLTLAGEVFYYNQKKKKEDAVEVKKVADNADKSHKFSKPEGGTITIGDSFKPVMTDKDRMRVSHIALYPRSRNRLPVID